MHTAPGYFRQIARGLYDSLALQNHAVGIVRSRMRKSSLASVNGDAWPFKRANKAIICHVPELQSQTHPAECHPRGPDSKKCTIRCMEAHRLKVHHSVLHASARTFDRMHAPEEGGLGEILLQGCQHADMQRRTAPDIDARRAVAAPLVTLFQQDAEAEILLMTSC